MTTGGCCCPCCSFSSNISSLNDCTTLPSEPLQRTVHYKLWDSALQQSDIMTVHVICIICQILLIIQLFHARSWVSVGGYHTAPVSPYLPGISDRSPSFSPDGLCVHGFHGNLLHWLLRQLWQLLPLLLWHLVWFSTAAVLKKEVKSWMHLHTNFCIHTTFILIPWKQQLVTLYTLQETPSLRHWKQCA